MEIFLTGGTGFIGGWVARELRERGHNLRALVRSPGRAQQLRHSAELVMGGLYDAQALARGARGADLVVHIAGVLAESKAGEFTRINVNGTRNLLDAAVAAGSVTRFVLVSSIAAQGPSSLARAVDEEMPCEPVSAYGYSKLQAEQMARAYREYLPVTIVRPPVVFGPGDTGTLPLFKLARLGVVPLVGSSEQRSSVIYVEDLARGISDAALHPAASNETFYFAEATAHTTVALLSCLGEVMGRRVRVVPVPRPAAWGAAWMGGSIGPLLGLPSLLNRDKLAEMLSESWVCTTERARTLLGWHERVSFREGAELTYAWYKQHGWL